MYIERSMREHDRQLGEIVFYHAGTRIATSGNEGLIQHVSVSDWHWPSCGISWRHCHGIRVVFLLSSSFCLQGVRLHSLWMVAVAFSSTSMRKFSRASSYIKWEHVYFEMPIVAFMNFTFTPSMVAGSFVNFSHIRWIP